MVRALLAYLPGSSGFAWLVTKERGNQWCLYSSCTILAQLAEQGPTRVSMLGPAAFWTTAMTRQPVYSALPWGVV